MRIEMVGTAPLLMHNIRLADDQDPYVKEIKKLTAKKTKKTDDDKMEIDRLSFAGGLYFDPDLGPYMPAENIFRCLMEAGSLTRSGKKIERGVIFEGTRARLEYEGPRDIETLWNDNGDSPFVDRRMVAVQRQRIPRVRPIFPNWALAMGVDIDPQVIDRDEFEDIVAKAGRLIGLGDYRRFYGKFDGKVTE
jgi:hypothetical protein